MSDKRYPTRMHEVLGVEPYERFSISSTTPWHGRWLFVDECGDLREEGVKPPFDRAAVFLVNHPECIIRKPRLTGEQVRVLEALYEVFDFKWLAKQKDGQVMAYANRPNKSDDWYGCWFSGEGDNEEDYGWKVKASSPVCGLISWSDPEPLDIVQTLTAERDAAARDDTTTVTRDVCYDHGEITNYGAESCDKCGAKQPERYPHCPGCGRRIER